MDLPPAPARSTTTSSGLDPHPSAIVCEDDEEVRRAVVAALERAGFTVLGVADRGLEVVRLAGELSPDLVVLDLALAGSFGVRLVSVLKSVRPAVTVVVLTPFAGLTHEILAAGASAVVPLVDLRMLAPVLVEVAAAQSAAG